MFVLYKNPATSKPRVQQSEEQKSRKPSYESQSGSLFGMLAFVFFVFEVELSMQRDPLNANTNNGGLR